MRKRVRARNRELGSERRKAGALLFAAWTAGIAATAFAQDTALEVTLQVVDDVSAIEGALMPLEEEPAHPTDADATPATEISPPAPSSPAAEPADEVVR